MQQTMQHQSRQCNRRGAICALIDALGGEDALAHAAAGDGPLPTPSTVRGWKARGLPQRRASAVLAHARALRLPVTKAMVDAATYANSGSMVPANQPRAVATLIGRVRRVFLGRAR